MPEAPLAACCDLEPALVPPQAALAHLLDATLPPDAVEAVPLHRAACRVLAEPIVAPAMLPTFDHAAMDGYALHAADLDAGSPRMIRRVAAGDEAGPAIVAGTAIRVLTGAPVPAGSAAVIMEEQVSLADGRLIFTATVREGQNIRRAGQDIERGTSLLAPGRRLGARHVALLAALGIDRVAVRPVPRIGVLSAGNELLRGHVRDSNRPMLLALLDAAGAETQDLGIVADDVAALTDALSRAASGLDMIVSTGGIAGSDADHLADAVFRAGGSAEVMRLAQKPGKPLGHGHIGRTRCLLLPGNPVAALVGLVTLGLPMLARLAGAEPHAAMLLETTLAKPLHRKPGREEYRPAHRIGTDATGLPLVESLGEGGSASLGPLIDADGLLRLPAATARFEAGARLSFLPFPAGG